MGVGSQIKSNEADRLSQVLMDLEGCRKEFYSGGHMELMKRFHPEEEGGDIFYSVAVAWRMKTVLRGCCIS
jgi:hypothetical protein